MVIGSTREKRLDRGCDLLRAAPELLIRKAAYRVWDIGHRIVRHTANFGDHLDRGAEGIGTDNGCGDAFFLKLDSIVHTARRAGPSVANSGDGEVAFFSHFRINFGLRRSGVVFFR